MPPVHSLAQAKDRDEPGQFRFLRAIATGGWQSIEAASDPPQRSDLDHDHPPHRGWLTSRRHLASTGGRACSVAHSR